MKKIDDVQLLYKDYLQKLKKSDVVSLLDNYQIDFPKNGKKDILIDLVLNNLDLIVDNTLDIFQEDDLSSINYVLKKKGYVVVKVNYLLQSFLDKMVKNNLIIKQEDDEYVLPKEIYSLFKEKIKKKSVVNKIKENTKEYSLILGNIDAYGVIEFNYFYDNYSKIYKLTRDVALNRIKKIAYFYNDINIIKDKNTTYLASSKVKNLKEAKKYIKNDIRIAVYTNEELINIHNFQYFKKVRSYKKIIKFIDNHFDVEKGSFKIINNVFIKPYIEENQLSAEKSESKLNELSDKYFEFSKEKQKNKFQDLVKNFAHDYPRWELRGHSEKDKI